MKRLLFILLFVPIISVSQQYTRTLNPYTNRWDIILDFNYLKGEFSALRDTSKWTETSEYIFPKNLMKPVGIGTNTPNGQLEVAGSILGDELYIQDIDGIGMSFFPNLLFQINAHSMITTMQQDLLTEGDYPFTLYNGIGDGWYNTFGVTKDSMYYHGEEETQLFKVTSSGELYAALLPEDTGTHFVKWDNVTKQFKSDNSILDSIGEYKDHGNLIGLSDDDHSQYALLNGRFNDELHIDTIRAYGSGTTVTIDDQLLSYQHRIIQSGGFAQVQFNDVNHWIGRESSSHKLKIYSEDHISFDVNGNITIFDGRLYPQDDLFGGLGTSVNRFYDLFTSNITDDGTNIYLKVPETDYDTFLVIKNDTLAKAYCDFALNRPLPLPDLNDDLLVDASDLSEWTNYVARTDLVDDDIYALDFNMNGHVDLNDAAFIHSCYGMSINDPTDSAFIEAQRSFLRSQSFTAQFGDSIFNIVGQIFINQYWDKSTDDLTGYIPIFDTTARSVTLNEIGTATLENQLGMRLVHYTDFGLGGDDDQDLSYTAATRALDITGGTGVTLPLFDPESTNAGLVPGGDEMGETYYLDATGAWNQPVGLVTASSLGNNPIYAGRDGNDLEFYGIREGKWVDITKSGDTSWTIAADSSLIVNAVTNLLDDYQLKSDTNNYDATCYYVDSVTLFHTENGAVEMKDNTVLRIDDGDKLSFVNNVGDSAKIYMAGENFVIHPENGFETQLYSDLYVMGDTLYMDEMTRAKKANMVFWDDVSGVFTVEDTTGIGGSDNLGNHTATDDLDMNNFDITKVADMDVGGTALVVDGTNDLVAINQASGTATLDVFTSEDEYILNLTKSKTINGSTGAGPGITFSRALDAMGAISSGDVTGIIRTRGYDGSVFRNVTNIQGAAQTVSGSTMSGQLRFLTNNTSGNMTERLEINEDGTVGINNTTAESILDVGGSFAIPVTLISTNTTLDGTHHTILVDNNDTGVGRITVTLPQASTCDGREYLIKLYDEGVGGNGFTIDAYSTERIYLTQGASAETYNFDSEGGSVTIQSYNGGWVVTNWCLAPEGW